MRELHCGTITSGSVVIGQCRLKGWQLWLYVLCEPVCLGCMPECVLVVETFTALARARETRVVSLSCQTTFL